MICQNQDLALLAKTHRRSLFRFILRKIGNPSDADDLVQQSFIEAHRAILSFRGESELWTWVCGIAMNLVRNHLSRAPNRVYEFISDDVLLPQADDSDGPEVLTQRLQMMRLLYEEVGGLPEDMRQIFIMVAIDGSSYEEAATAFDIPIGTVRSRLFRAREAIKMRLPGLKDSLRF
jgi:RNA polymerase sigma-70 factor (ECF subfamily)